MGDKTKSGNTESIMGTRPGAEGGLRFVRHIVQLLGSGLKDEMSNSSNSLQSGLGYRVCGNGGIGKPCVNSIFSIHLHFFFLRACLKIVHCQVIPHYFFCLGLFFFLNGIILIFP